MVEVLGFLSTWSAVGRYRMVEQADPLHELSNDLASVWGTKERRQVRWPLTLRAARKQL